MTTVNINTSSHSSGSTSTSTSSISMKTYPPIPVDSYSVEIGIGLLSTLTERLIQLVASAARFVLITDSNLERLYLQSIKLQFKQVSHSTSIQSNRMSQA